MAEPFSLDVGYVFGTFITGIIGYDEDNHPIGAPITGVAAVFTPDLNPPLVRSMGANPSSVTVNPIRAVSNSAGQLVLSDGVTPADAMPVGVPLIASIGRNIDPNGWTWTLLLSAPGLPALRLTFAIEANESIDLASIVTIDPSSGQDIIAWKEAVRQTQADVIIANASAASASLAAQQASVSAQQASIAATTASTARDQAQSYASKALTNSTAAASSATAAANSASDAETRRVAAAASASAASLSQSAAAMAAGNAVTANEAANSAKNAAIAAQNAANSSVAAAETARQQAAASATTASNQASTATTQAQNALTQAQNALTQAQAAATQAQNAATSATNAATQAQTATNQAAVATQKATAAANSADAAAGSATASAASQTVAGTSADTASAAANSATTALASAQSILDSFNTNKGVANGFATLDGTGKLVASQLPVSAMEYKGTWNAATNTPPLNDANGNQGDLYFVSVAGTKNLGSGSVQYDVHDQLIYNGTKYEKIDNTDAVVSVAGKIGAVDLVPADVKLDKVDNTSDSEKPISNAQQTVLNDTVNGATIVGRDLVLQKIGGLTANAGTIVNALSIGTVATGAVGTNALATITGSAPNQVLNLTLPTGATGAVNTLSVGTVTTSAPGSSAAVTITGTAPNQTLNLTLPTGATGPANSLSIGTVTTGAAGAAAAATITGTAPAQSLSLTIPQGIQGIPGDLMPVTTGTSGTTIDLTAAGLPSTDRYVMSGNITGITLPTTTTSRSGTVTLVMVQDATGNRTITWPASVLWSEGVKAQPSTAPGSISVFNLEWTGTEWLGFKAGQNFA